MDVIHEARMYEQLGVRPEAEDYVIVKSMADQFHGGLETLRHGRRVRVPGVPSARQPASQRAPSTARVQCAPLESQESGIQPDGNAGSRVDRRRGLEVLAGLEARGDGRHAGWLVPAALVPVCVPNAHYIGRPVKLEAVLANEDVLRPDDYPVRFRVCGPAGIAWEQSSHGASRHAATRRGWTTGDPRDGRGGFLQWAGRRLRIGSIHRAGSCGHGSVLAVPPY